MRETALQQQLHKQNAQANTLTQPDEPHVHDWKGGLEKGLYVGGLDSPCACVHFSRKTMNTKRKSISQFFTVFRLEIKWLKKRCKSIYLLSTHTHTHSGHSQYSYSYSYLIASFVPALQCAQQQFAQHITHTDTHTHTEMQMYLVHPHTRTCCNVANSRCKSLRLASKNVATLPKCFRFRLPSRFRCCKPPNSAGGRALSLPPGGSCSSKQSPHVALAVDN